MFYVLCIDACMQSKNSKAKSGRLTHQHQIVVASGEKGTRGNYFWNVDFGQKFEEIMTKY